MSELTMNSYDCKAPMYINFACGTSEEDINYFCIDHEEEVHVKEEVQSPEEFVTPNEYAKERSNRRRSRSVGDMLTLGSDSQIYQLRNVMQNMAIAESCESLDNPSTSNNALSSAESKENINARQAKRDLRNGKYETMAEQVHRFHRQTPKRFHSVTSKANAIQVLQELNSNQYIKPKTPRLLTKSRSRPINIMSYEERKELEYQEALKNKLKGRKFNRELLHRVPSLPNVARMPVTKFEPFKLSQPKKRSIVLDDKPPVFKARSIPENIFEGPMGIKPKPPPKTTVPKTPNIKMPKKSPSRRNNTPHAGVPNVPKQGPTKIVPFSFEERDKHMMKRKEEYIQKFMEEEKKNMETLPPRPMPRFGTPTKTVQKAPTVIAKTPNFASAALRQEAERRFKAKIEQEEQEAKAKAEFKARPAKILDMKPFEPELYHQPVEVQEFALSSQSRAKARQAFDEKIKQKEQERLLLQQEQEVQRKRTEEEELVAIRKTLVTKAQPIRHYKPIEVKRSEKAVTAPCTPKLGPKYHSKK